jgi:phenylalanyl-tRNA synthetase alpha chain
MAPTGGRDGLDDAHGVAAHALAEIAAAADLQALDDIRNRYLGRKDGLLTVHRRALGKLADAEAKRQLGQTINALFERVEEALSERQSALRRDAEQRALRDEAVDLTVPPPPLRRGSLHPVTRAAREIRRIFGHLGYTAVGGPEIEYDRYNFELVNQPEGHPARLLRTHTSPVQIRAMVALGAPLKVIVPGKTFRRDNDPTHSPMFHQVEGLYVDEDVSVADLKGTLEFFARSMFGPARAIRLRPHHFPFTEPSLEVDVSCMVCGGDGCNTCKGSGWIEILGSGMVHPDVLRNGGVDPERYSGFAFGMGIERIAQLAYGIDDVRLLYENDVRFIRQS